MPLVDADEDEDDDSGESDLSDDENEEKDEKAGDEDSDAEDEDEFSDEMDDEETITDKLRMKIHEALGDSAALTDTVRLTLSFLTVIFVYPCDSFVYLGENRNQLILMTFLTAKWRVWTKPWAQPSKSSARPVPSRRITANCPKTR